MMLDLKRDQLSRAMDEFLISHTRMHFAALALNEVDGLHYQELLQIAIFNLNYSCPLNYSRMIPL